MDNQKSFSDTGLAAEWQPTAAASRLDDEAEVAYLAGRLPPHVQVHEWLARLGRAERQHQPSV